MKPEVVRQPAVSLLAMRAAIPLAVAVGLGSGLLLTGPVTRLIDGGAVPSETQGRSLSAVNPFRAWMGTSGELVLLLGTDDSGANTDVIVALQVGDSITRAIQVPRDSYVYSSRFGPVKANALYAFGGTEEVKYELSRLMGAPINHHIIVDLDVIHTISDLIGGVEVDVPKRLYYVDRSQDLFIDLEPGRQQLRGRDLEGFLRWRHDEEGDIGRLERQQMVLHAVMNKLTRPDTLLRLPVLLGAARQGIDTDLGPMELGGLLTRIGTTDLETERLDGQPFYQDGISYWDAVWPDLSERSLEHEPEADRFVF
jgi:LCP family protein required for cell wall assembly